MNYEAVNPQQEIFISEFESRTITIGNCGKNNENGEPCPDMCTCTDCELGLTTLRDLHIF